MDKAEKKIEYPCSYCEVIVGTNFSLKRHIKRLHKDVNLESKPGSCVCLQCKETFVRIVDLRNHLTRVHGTKFSKETIKFESESEFERWKINLEGKDMCHFIKKQGPKSLSTGARVAYYQCNRSGTYRNSSRVDSRIRQMKSQGSSKIGWNCTATIKAKRNPNQTLDVEVCYTHYGHSKDIKHIPVNKTYESNLKNLKERIQQRIQQLLVKIQECDNLEVLQELDKNLQHILETFKLSLAENNALNDHDYNKMSETQLPSANKKRKRGGNIRYAKSTEGSNASKTTDLTCCKCLLDRDTDMIQCDGCDHWFDWACAGITEARDEWYCESCQYIRIKQ